MRKISCSCVLILLLAGTAIVKSAFAGNEKNLGLNVIVHTDFIVPVSSFKGLSKVGYGCSVTATQEVGWNLFTGVTVGFWAFNENGDTLQTLYMVPFLFTAGYTFRIVKGFYIQPQVSAGGNFVVLKQYAVTDKGVDSVLFKTGPSFGYMLDINLLFTIDTEYGLIIEKKSQHHLVSISAGIGYRF